MKKQFFNSLKFKKFDERSFHHHLDPFLVRLNISGHKTILWDVQQSSWQQC